MLWGGYTPFARGSLSHNASHPFQHCLAHIIDSASAVIAHVEAEARGEQTGWRTVYLTDTAN